MLRRSDLPRGERRKWRNIPTQCGTGYLHQSKLEATRCDELHLLERGGMISQLEAHPQPRYRLDVGDTHIADYLADFRYVDEDGNVRVEDVKGVLTKDAALKLKLMKACHGIEVELVRRTGRRR